MDALNARYKSLCLSVCLSVDECDGQLCDGSSQNQNHQAALLHKLTLLIYRVLIIMMVIIIH